MGNSEDRIGIAIIERSLCETLSTLWDGPISPKDLEAIERAIRAFLVSPVLIASRQKDFRTGSPFNPATGQPRDYKEPFGDHLLDYEFLHPGEPHPYTEIGNEESDFLTSLVMSEFTCEALKILPAWITREGQAFAYLDAWLEELPNKTCSLCAEDMFDWEFERNPFRGKASVQMYMDLVRPDFEAQYLVGCHRAGLTVYGRSLVTRVCAEHLFSRWPDYLFKTLGEEFKRASEETHSSGVRLTLPLLTAILLSRAPRRSDIPVTLRDLREEYSEPRRKLWNMMLDMWAAPVFEQQLRILRQLDQAAYSIFQAAFPERFDVLSLGINATDLLKGRFSSTLSNIREQSRPKARVAAISFASKLSKDLRKHLMSSRDILQRHLTDCELTEFSTSR